MRLTKLHRSVCSDLQTVAANVKKAKTAVIFSSAPLAVPAVPLINIIMAAHLVRLLPRFFTLYLFLHCAFSSLVISMLAAPSSFHAFFFFFFNFFHFSNDDFQPTCRASTRFRIRAQVQLTWMLWLQRSAGRGTWRIQPMWGLTANALFGWWLVFASGVSLLLSLCLYLFLFFFFSNSILKFSDSSLFTLFFFLPPQKKKMILLVSF